MKLFNRKNKSKDDLINEEFDYSHYKKIAISNVTYRFKNHPDLLNEAIKCVNLIEGDPRDLSIAFSNEIYNEEDKYNIYVSIKMMQWLTRMAMFHGCFWTKWNCDIPEEAKTSIEKFNIFTQSFDVKKCKTVEQLRYRGSK